MFTFRNSKDTTSSLPLLIGLIGPSGGGKTKSALRLAAGIRKVRGGKIVALDTEARRMLHYKNEFDFQHCEFNAPFSSLRYCEAVEAAAKEANGGVVILDSTSHEHSGAGGYLEYHEAELDRIAGTDWKKRERATFSAWIRPAADRQKLINKVLQTDCAFIFNFRAKEKIKVVAGGQPIPLGWQAIAGEEFAYEMTVRCLLTPGANGVPDWSEEAFKNHVAKLGDSHRAMFPVGKQLDESIGERLAIWAEGDSSSQPDKILSVSVISPGTGYTSKPAGGREFVSTPPTIEVDPVKTDWKQFGKEFTSQLKKCTSLEELEELKVNNTDKLLGMADEWKTGFAKIEANILEVVKNLIPIEEIIK